MKAKLSKEEGWYDLYRIDEDGKRVTFASTEYYKQKLSLKNCQAIELGYDLDELAEKHYDLHIKRGHTEEDSLQRKIDFILGFVSALEIIGDKKFSEEDMEGCWYSAHQAGRFEGKGIAEKDWQTFDTYIRASLQQTEWDCIVEMEKVYDGLDEMAQPQYSKQPKLDVDGCLILKRK